MLRECLLFERILLYVFTGMGKIVVQNFLLKYKTGKNQALTVEHKNVDVKIMAAHTLGSLESLGSLGSL